MWDAQSGALLRTLNASDAGKPAVAAYEARLQRVARPFLAQMSDLLKPTPKQKTK